MNLLPWVIVGAGRVGRALALLAEVHGATISATWNRSEDAARTTSALLGAPSCARFGELDVLRDVLAGPALVWITVSDDALEDVAREVADWISEDSIVLHTCGSISSEVLSQQGIRAHVGSLHPLLAIADPHEALDAMGRCTWTAEGDDLAVETAQRVLSPLGVEAMAIKPSAKALYHASAVTSAGLLVSLMDAAFAMASEAGLSAQQARQMLLPLARSCIDNLEKMSSAEALTGPVARGDEATLARHRKSLRSHPDLLEVYEVLTRRGVAMLDD